MHGDERRSKDQRDDDYKLHAWVYAVQCKNEGRIFEPAEPEVKRPYYGIYVDEYCISGDTLHTKRRWLCLSTLPVTEYETIWIQHVFCLVRRFSQVFDGSSTELVSLGDLDPPIIRIRG